MKSSFDELVEAAASYAEQAVDVEAVAKEIALWSDAHFERALYMGMSKTKKSDGSSGFPEEFLIARRDKNLKSGKETRSFSIIRPDYRDNPEGFGGNHLVVAIINKIKEATERSSKLGVAIMTSEKAWNDFCQGPIYEARKEGDMLSSVLSEVNAPKIRRRGI